MPRVDAGEVDCQTEARSPVYFLFFLQSTYLRFERLSLPQLHAWMPLTQTYFAFFSTRFETCYFLHILRRCLVHSFFTGLHPPLPGILGFTLLLHYTSGLLYDYSA